MLNIMDQLRYMKNIRRIRKKIECFFKLKLMVFSNNNIFSNNNLSINIYH